MKNLLLGTAAAALMSSAPAFAWQPGPVTIFNHTDPVEIVKVIFREGTVVRSKFPLELPGGQNRMFGPIPEVGSCWQDLFVRISLPAMGADKVFKAATPMDVCHEKNINVSSVWNGYSTGLSPIVIVHW